MQTNSSDVGALVPGLSGESFEELNEFLLNIVVRQLYAAEFIDFAHEILDIDRLDLPPIWRTFGGQLALDAAHGGLDASDIEYHRRGLDLLARYPEVARNLKVRGLFELLCLMWFNGEGNLEGELEQLAQDWPELIRRYEHHLPCGVLEDRPIVDALGLLTGCYPPPCGKCSMCRRIYPLDGLPRDYGSPPSYAALKVWAAEDAEYDWVEPRQKTPRRGKAVDNPHP